MRNHLTSVVGGTLLITVFSLLPVTQASADCSGSAVAAGNVQTCTSDSSIGVEATTTSPGAQGSAPGSVWSPAAPVAPLPEGAVVVNGEVICVPTEGKGCLTPYPQPPSGAASVVDVRATAQSAVASLGVPAPAIRLAPEPANNQWGALAVGLPIWVWVDDPGSVGTSTSQDGIDISLNAARSSVTFDWGDGTSSVCTQMLERPAGTDPLMASPACGHAYLKAGDFTITATAAWNVGWQALGQQGQVDLSSSATYELPIREFVTVVIG